MCAETAVAPLGLMPLAVCHYSCCSLRLMPPPVCHYSCCSVEADAALVCHCSCCSVGADAALACVAAVALLTGHAIHSIMLNVPKISKFVLPCFHSKTVRYRMYLRSGFNNWIWFYEL